jgi:smad nuclear-interacting protein 1
MSDGNYRKRNRWGNPSEDSAAVSDQAALQALLDSAQSREQEKQQQLRSNTTSVSHKDRLSSPRKKLNTSKAEGSNYYGPAAGAREGEEPGHRNSKASPGDETNTQNGDNEPIENKQKANFGLSGALQQAAGAAAAGGNVYKGVVLQFREPREARAPNTLWRLYVYKGVESKEPLETLHISQQSAYLFGRNAEIADIFLAHASCSSQHAVLQYRALPDKATGKLKCQPYLMDLESSNGTFINGVKIDAARYYQLRSGDVLKFGASTREYVLLTSTTTSL